MEIPKAFRGECFDVREGFTVCDTNGNVELHDHKIHPNGDEFLSAVFIGIHNREFAYFAFVNIDMKILVVAFAL